MRLQAVQPGWSLAPAHFHHPRRVHVVFWGTMGSNIRAVAVRWPDSECGNRVTAVFVPYSGMG